MTEDLINIITLPNEKHSIKEAVITLFLKTPILNLIEFNSFYDKLLSEIFTKKEEVNKVQVTFNPKDSTLDKSDSKNSGFRLYRVSENETDLLMQVLNDSHRQFISLHCLKYIRWKDFRGDFVRILKILDNWIDNNVVAFSLNYIDELKIKADRIPLSDILNSKSDLLPKGIFNTQNSFLVFNTEKGLDNAEYRHFDRIELKVENKTISISHNSIIPIGHHDSFSDFVKCSTCSSKLDWAHDHNKELLNDILSIEVQKIIGLI